jgi:hypothetical protein
MAVYPIPVKITFISLFYKKYFFEAGRGGMEEGGTDRETGAGIGLFGTDNCIG